MESEKKKKRGVRRLSRERPQKWEVSGTRENRSSREEKERYSSNYNGKKKKGTSHVTPSRGGYKRRSVMILGEKKEKGNRADVSVCRRIGKDQPSVHRT